jgi:hypothetical protein
MKKSLYLGGDKQAHFKKKKIKGMVGVKVFTPGLWKLFPLEKG